MEWLTTSLLLDQLKRGDDGAWQRLLVRFEAPLRGLALKVGVEPAQAGDVCSESVLALLDGLRTGRYERGKGRLSSWLLGIGRMKALQAIDLCRRRRTTSLGESAADALPALDEQGLDAEWERSWSENIVSLSLAQVRTEVDATTFAAFEAVVVREEKPDTVAARLGMTSNAVYLAKHRILKRLRALREELEATI